MYNYLWSTTFATDKFFCPEYEWVIKGQKFMCAVPLTLIKKEASGFLWSRTWYEEDVEVMMKELHQLVEMTRENPSGPWVDLYPHPAIPAV